MTEVFMNGLLKPDYGRMYGVMCEGLKRNLGKAISYLFIFEFLYAFASSVCLFPVSGKKLDFSMRNVNLLVTVGLFFILSIFSFMIVSGLNRVFTCMSRNIKYSFHDIFSCFQNDFKRSFYISTVFALILIGAIFCVFYIYLMNRTAIDGFMTDYFKLLDTQEFELVDFVVKSVSVVLLSGTIFLLVALPFMFVWNILSDYDTLGAFVSLKNSFVLMVPRYFHFIGFVIFSVFKNVFFIVVLFTINSMIAESALYILSIGIGFLIFLQQYTIFSKIMISLPIYYYSLLSLNGMLPSSCAQADSSGETVDVVAGDSDLDDDSHFGDE